MSELLDQIKQYIEDGEMSFLIGAGFSRNVNKDAYPMWGGLLKDAIWNMFGSGKRTEQKEKEVMAKVEKEYGYLGFASLLVRKAGYHEAIDTYIESKTPYIRTVSGKPVLLLNGKPLRYAVNQDCHLLLKNLDIQNIYTFNYDNALEFFMGEEAKLSLEKKIVDTEREIEELQVEESELGKQEFSLQEKLAERISAESKMEHSTAVENADEETTTSQKLEQKLQDVRKDLYLKRVELNELRAELETDKRNLKTYYNVVKDSYEISLSAKRKSIYKIHGSLRENAIQDYGFDGDTHTQYIITQEDYDTYNEKHGAFVSMMRIDLLRSRFCIVGVSGGDANFLAWINWVKDVLDKTKDRAKRGKEKQHQSFFVYSGSDDMPEELVLMLKNHFIEPVILKDIFPLSKTNEERIKLFLEYLQPFSNKDTSKFTDLWSKISATKLFNRNVEPFTEANASELFRLSAFNKFNAPAAAVHYAATNVQFAARNYLKDGASKADRLIYAAAIRSTLMPIDLSCSEADLDQMYKETDDEIKTVFEESYQRMELLQHLSKKNKTQIKEISYTRFLYDLFDFRFPTRDEVEKLSVCSGIDFVRRYSLLMLLHNDNSHEDNLGSAVFNSPQELVLAADWLRCIGYKNTNLYKKADDCKQQGKLLSLYEYYKAYVLAMHRKEDPKNYGNTSNTIYLDKYAIDVANAAVLLNSFIELGICFAGRTIMEDSEWVKIVRALKQRYPVAMAFYTIVRNSKDSTIKLVAQELMYDDFSRQVLPTVLKNIIGSLVSETTPTYLKGKMAQFASEILPAVNQRHWSRLIVKNAENILGEADNSSQNYELTKSMYGFVASALQYISAKELRLKLLKRVLENVDMDSRSGSYYNTIVIAARDQLKSSDFAPLNDLVLAFAEKLSKKNNQQVGFIVMNLLILLEGENKLMVLKRMEYRMVRDAYLIGGYVYHIKDYPELVKSFTEYFLQGEDLWHTGIFKDGIHMGNGTVEVSKIDKLLKFNEKQVEYIYNDMKQILGKIDETLQWVNCHKEDNVWFSPENSFMEVVIDMRLFVNNRRKQLARYKDFEETNNMLVNVYEQCFFGKSIFQLISDDEMYRAVRKILTESELYGIDCFRLEYEQFLSSIIAKNSKELKTLFRHIGWAIKHYKSFFFNDDFKRLIAALLKVYRPYFEATNEEPHGWDLMGCQKEVAEKELVSISKTIEGWGVKDEFWNLYKRVFYNN